MLRGGVAAVLALTAGAAVAAPGDPWPPRLPGKDPLAAKAWGEAHVMQDDWVLTGTTDSQVWYVSTLPNPAPNYPLVRDWIRAEVFDASGSSRSHLALVEVDCAGQRARNVESYFYQFNNLRGSFHMREEPVTWEPFGSGSIRESYARVICRGAAP